MLRHTKPNSSSYTQAGDNTSNKTLGVSSLESVIYIYIIYTTVTLRCCGYLSWFFPHIKECVEACLLFSILMTSIALLVIRSYNPTINWTTKKEGCNGLFPLMPMMHHAKSPSKVKIYPNWIGPVNYHHRHRIPIPFPCCRLVPRRRCHLPRM